MNLILVQFHLLFRDVFACFSDVYNFSMIIKYAFIWTEKCLKRLKTILSQLTYSRSHVNISFWPSGSKTASFSLFFILFGTFSGYVFMIFFNFSLFFRCYDLNACDFPVPMSGLHCGRPSWLAPLNFMVEIQLSEPFSTSTMKFTHRNWWIICIQTVSSRNN